MRDHTATAAQQIQERPRARPAEGITLSPELIEEFLDGLERSGCAPETLKSYRRKLEQLRQYLPEDQRILARTLEAWRASLIEQGYSTSTVNICTSVANGLVKHCGRREFQIEKLLKRDHGVQPELTRNEYLRLLSTARTLGKEREYLMIKVLGSTGLNLQEMPRVTVEAVTAGQLALPNSMLRFPGCLRGELLGYIRRQGILSGPVFLARNGALLRRTNITKMIRALSHDAQVDPEKATPRCLRKLYQSTWAGIEANIALLVEQAHERMLETEQLTIGWNQEERM